MDDNLRKQIMYNGVIGLKKDPNILELKDGKYLICNKLKNLIRFKNIILFLEVFAATFIYNYILDKNFNFLVENATGNDLKNVLLVTIIFMVSIGILAFVTPRLIIPKNLSTFYIKKIED